MFVGVDDADDFVDVADLWPRYPLERIEAFGVDEKWYENGSELAVVEVGVAEGR